MSTQRSANSLVVILLVIAWWRALQWYPQLPENLPIHFDARGVPDGWAAKDPFTWYLSPLLASLMAGGLSWLASWLPRLAATRPQNLNMPRKQVFTSLPPDARVHAMETTVQYLGSINVLTVLLFLFIVEGSARVATGTKASLSSWPVLVYLVVVIGAIPLMLRATNKRMSGA